MSIMSKQDIPIRSKGPVLLLLSDNRGNLIEVKSGDKVFNRYQFDPRNQLVELTNKHNEQTRYTYDGLGNRVKTAIDLDRPGNRRPGNAYGHDKNNNGNNGNANGQDINNGNNGNGNGNAYAYGHDKDGNPKPGWKHQFKREIMDINYVVDITSPYNNVLMSYGSHYQTQRYTYGLDRISMDFWSLDDKDNG